MCLFLICKKNNRCYNNVEDIMDRYKLPLGIKDYLPDECFSKSVIENKILDVFDKHCYEKLETPTLEYFSLYNKGVGKIDEEKLFKIQDSDGRIVVLRPDITMPISRIVSTKINPSIPSKYCYLGNSFKFIQDAYKLREFTQAGVEYINESSVFAEAEIIRLAIESLLASGLEEFLIDVGEVSFFKGIIESFNISEEDKINLAEHIYRKDIIGLKEHCLKFENLDSEQLEVLYQLPNLFGGIEICDKAEKFNLNEKSLNALDRLRQIYDLLETNGYNKYLSFDLSLVNSMNYYTGIVFKGITKNFGAPILSGGRYDSLNTAEKTIPAVGFAIGINNILVALQGSNKLPERVGADYVIGYDMLGYDKAMEASQQLRKDGYRVDTIFTDSQESMIEYQKSKDTLCKKLIFIGDKVEDNK